MLIETLQLEGVGPFRERLEIGPLEKGLNILAQPNEWGKSTLVKALGRALFDRYRSESEEIRQLRPVGSSLSPRVELVFSARGGRFRVVKGFLDRKGCELYRWQDGGWERTDESDKADQRLRDLLQAPPLEGRIVKPESWGFLRYLWARQDAPADWPDWGGASGETTRSRLAAVPIDHVGRALEKALRERSDLLLTATGKVKAGSPLALALEEKARVTRELQEVREKRAALEDLQQHFGRLSAELPVFSRELETRRDEAKRTREQAEAAEKLQLELASHQAEFNRLQDALLQLKRDESTLGDIAKAQELAARDREQIAKFRDAITAEIPKLEEAASRAQLAVSDAQERRSGVEARLQRQRGLLAIMQQREEHSRLSRQKERAEESLKQLRALEEARSRLPEITPARLKKLREFERDLRESRVRLETIGLRVTLKPEQTSSIAYAADGIAGETSLQAGETRTLHAAQMLALQLPGWGRVEIGSGALEAPKLQSEAARHESELKSALAELGFASLADAEAAHEQARTLDHQIKGGKEALQAHLGEWEDFPELATACTRIQAAIEQQQTLLQPTAEELAASVAGTRAQEEALQAQLEHLGAAERTTLKAANEARQAVEDATRKREEYAAQLAALEAKERGLTEQRQMLETRHAGGLAIALEQVQCDWVGAEARLKEARRRMPENVEKLPERSARAARALADTEAEVQRVAAELQQVEIRLTDRGGEGLYSREVELDEKLEWISAEVRRLETEGIAARLVSHLIHQHQAEATRQVLGPLENRLTEVFAGLTGNSSRRVWFDESLQVRGIGPSESELIPFEDLSRGAREQLLLALRAAVALELSADEPQCLVLDDVLVNTDSFRQQNVLDYLQELGTRVQILLLTCHAERYRGVGHLVRPRYGSETSEGSAILS